MDDDVIIECRTVTRTLGLCLLDGKLQQTIRQVKRFRSFFLVCLIKCC